MSTTHLPTRLLCEGLLAAELGVILLSGSHVLHWRLLLGENSTVCVWHGRLLLARERLVELVLGPRRGHLLVTGLRRATSLMLRCRCEMGGRRSSSRDESALLCAHSLLRKTALLHHLSSRTRSSAAELLLRRLLRKAGV